MPASDRGTAPAADPGEPPFTVEPLAEGVYAFIAGSDARATSNAGLVDLGPTALLYDTFLTPAAGRALRRTAERLLPGASLVVVNSHYHNDHTWGNQAFSDRPIIGSQRGRELFLTKGVEEAKGGPEEVNAVLAHFDSGPYGTDPEAPFWRGYLEALAGALTELELVAPTVAFSGELVLTGPRGPVRLVELEGHTASDIALLLPDQGIAFLGDLLFVAHHPWLGEGDPHALLRTLGRLEHEGLGRLVPGHGPVSDARWLGREAEYVRELLRLAEQASDAGTTPVQLSSVEMPAPYRAWRYGRFFRSSLRALYDRLPRRA